ncbi:creatininase family protein [Jiangella rhizosphaerae]|nr:creatininase family protein [Jiangella rhizosphaerae]
MILSWDEATREQLNAALPTSVVVLPVGAVEQHGPHLATGTDSRLAALLAAAAARRAHEEHGVSVVVAPALPFGASAHHLPFGGTLSLTAATMLAVLTDLLRSMIASGATRIVVVNGHGGNSGVVHAAAADVAAGHDGVAVAHLDYWRLVDPRADLNVPGHAGRFETSMMLATGWTPPDGEAYEPPRRAGALPPAEVLQVHSRRRWRDIDGWSDDPAGADPATGEEIVALAAAALARHLATFAQEPT